MIVGNTHKVEISAKHHEFLSNLGANKGLSVGQTLGKLLDMNITARSPKQETRKYTLTNEQAAAVDFAIKGHSVQINACAGSGKTTILKEISLGMPEKKGLYLTFNKKNADEAAKTFPPHSVECMTAHSLAYRALGYKYKNRLTGRKIKGFDIAREIGIQMIADLTRTVLGDVVLSVVDQFCYSADKEISDIHIPKIYDPLFEDKEDLIFIKQSIVFYATQVWSLLCEEDCVLPVNHDFYLKLWGLTEPDLSYDFIMLDESQDANPTMLNIIMNSNKQVIMVGDRHQSIYSWRGAVNAMASINLEKKVSITQSFRYGQAIANVASRVLTKGLNEDVKIFGNGQIESELTTLPCKVVLCRTNLKLFDTAMNLYQSKDNYKIHIVGNKGRYSDLFNLLSGAADLKNNNRTLVPELMHFTSWEEVMNYSDSEAGKHLAGFVRLANRYHIDHLKDTLVRISENTEEEADIVLSTVHKAKGMEWDSVKLENDFPLPGSDRFTDEEAHLLYVAITRAKKLLNIRDCNAVSLLM